MTEGVVVRKPEAFSPMAQGEVGQKLQPIVTREGQKEREQGVKALTCKIWARTHWPLGALRVRVTLKREEFRILMSRMGRKTSNRSLFDVEKAT
jgi:hypothetical protein